MWPFDWILRLLFGRGGSPDGIDEIAERLERYADRYANAGDFERADRARQAAKAARRAATVDHAKAIEERCLAELEGTASKPTPKKRTPSAAKSTVSRKPTGQPSAWRNNNPGRLRYDDAVEYGATSADDDGYAIFEDQVQGLKALCSWLMHHSNANTLEEALGQAMPQNVGKSPAQLLQSLQIDPSQSLQNLTDDQLQAVAAAFEQQDDATTGEVDFGQDSTEASSTPAVEDAPATGNDPGTISDDS